MKTPTRFSFILGLLALFIASYAFPKSLEDTIVFSDKGVGGISVETPFDIKIIKGLFPEFNVEPDISSSEGEEFPIIVVKDNAGNHLLDIYPDGTRKHIYLVKSTTKNNTEKVKNALGDPIGDTYATVYAGKKPRCIAGKEEESGSVLCAAPGAPHLIYSFEGAWNGPDGTLPPQNVLKSWKLSTFTWIGARTLVFSKK